jgi:hypothetical protein
VPSKILVQRSWNRVKERERERERAFKDLIVFHFNFNSNTPRMEEMSLELLKYDQEK